MNYTYNPTTLATIPELVHSYITSLASPIDSYLEDHILQSDIVVITTDQNEPAGYYGLFEGRLLTQFYLRPPFVKDGQSLFVDVLNRTKAESAFIPTCDELFLSHALDQEPTIAKQAYFFQDGSNTQSVGPIQTTADFRPALATDVDAIYAMSGDFLDHLEDRIADDQIFILTEADKLVGLGIIVPCQLLTDYSSIGMFIHQQHRRQGLGRTMLLHLKQWCYDHGRQPIAGCGYSNHLSKKTLESAGMITKTRLLKLTFTHPLDDITQSGLS